MRKFIPAIEKERVVSKTVDTQLFQGQFTPASGTTVNVKRPHQYKSVETSGGDISGETANVFEAGYATATVQNYITVFIDWTNKEEALQLDQLDKILQPVAEEVVTTLESNLCDYMIKYAGLTSGDPDQPLNAWTDVAYQASLMRAIGVPSGEKYCIVNPFRQQALASTQTGLYASNELVRTAWEEATIAPMFAGMRVLSSNSLSTWTTSAAADRAGALDGAPTATHVSTKDTYTQTISVTGLTALATIKAGDVLEFTGTGANARSYIHQKTRKTAFNSSDDPIKWRCTVTADVTLDGSGEGDLVVTGPAIYETGSQYNTISAALADTDVFNILGTASTEYQPSLFYHKNAVSVAFVKLPKLYSTDTVATTEDGISIRISKYANGDTNTQTIRFDILPAFAILNPFYLGKGFGFA